MKLTTERFKHCDLVKISGRIDSATSPKLEETLQELMEDGRYKIVLDMSDVEFTSSAGLRVIINAQKACKKTNRGEVALAAVPERIYETLDFAGLLPIFNIYGDVVHAVGNI